MTRTTAPATTAPARRATPPRLPARLLAGGLLLVGGLLPAGCDQIEAMTGAAGETPHGGEHADGEHADAHGGAHAGGHEGHGHPEHKILVTSPLVKDVVSTQQYVCQIHSRRHIEVRALEGGYLEEIKIQEGQEVKRGQTMFEVVPVLYKARLDSDEAEAQLAQVEYDNTRKLVEQRIVSSQELKLAQAKLAKAEAKVRLARAELDFTDIKAPFDGIVDRQLCQEGSLLEEGDVLTTLSDNSVVWAYFNVPESRYLDYKAELDRAADADDDQPDEAEPDDDQPDDDQEEDGGDDPRRLRVELVLANGRTFPQAGTIGAIEADFNNETGNIAFRADFKNPDGLLRNGQTGTVKIHRDLKDAVVIPQRATYEILAKRYVFVVGEDGVVRQRDITVSKELEDIFVVSGGLDGTEKIVLEGVRQIRDGDRIHYEYRDPRDVLDQLKYHAE